MIKQKKILTTEEALLIGTLLEIKWDNFDLNQFKKGLETELQPGLNKNDVNLNELSVAGKIVMMRLNESPDYYNNTGKLEVRQSGLSKHIIKHYAVNATADSIVDPPFTETYDSSFNKNKRENNKLLLDD